MECRADLLHKNGSRIKLPARIVPGLVILLNAHRYATEIQRDHWDFAVEISRLRNAGLDDNEFRLLVCRELVEHAREITMPGVDQREFRGEGALTFSRRSCFVLTAGGAALAQQTVLVAADAVPGPLNGLGTYFSHDQAEMLSMPTNGNGQAFGIHYPPNGQEQRMIRPRWDGDRRQLLMGDRIVKEFKLNSPNQETVLMVFEEEGWPVRIDDPLPPHPDLDSKQRLHDTIKSLNRNQKARSIRFMGDGTGLAIRWEAIPPDH